MSIDLTDVTKRFDAHRAVDAITCTIPTGAFFAIVGASGCGKSTLLRLIAGLEPVSAGRIALGGEVMSTPDRHVPSEARNVGFVFQSYALWPHLSVRGNVAFPAEMAGMSRAQAAEHAKAHLGTVDLLPYADRKPADLSGGQRQRVALARCLSQGARTILMDEPLANLDPHLRQTMERELVAFHREAGATTLYITHDQREAMAVADQMAVMAEGRFLQVGPPEDIYARPMSKAVARFIGAGSLQSVEVSDGAVRLAGQPVPISAQGHGPATALIRPEEIAVTAPEATALRGQVTDALYRGGHWEASVEVPGCDAPFEVTARQRLVPGEAVGLQITGGWCLPDSA